MSDLTSFLTGSSVPEPIQINETKSPPSAATIQADKDRRVDCQGYWGVCDFIKGVQTYVVTQSAQNGGQACPNKTGDVKQCGVDYMNQLKTWLLSLMTVQNFTMMVFILIILAIMRGVFSTMKEFFGGGGGGGRVTVVS
jgi:hypothetical protein